MGYHPDDQTATVFATISVNSFTGLIFYLLFELFRYQSDIYYSKFRHNPSRTPSKPPLGLFRWISPLLAINDQETLRCIGMDAYIFLKFLKLCLKFCLFCSFFNILVLCPTYYTSYGHQEGIAGINLYTMGNIPPGGKRLWASCVFCWLYNCYFLYLIHEEYRSFVILRQHYFYSGDPKDEPQRYYSILVENIPFYYRTNTRLKQLFNEWFPNQVHSTSISCNVEILTTLLLQRDQYLDELERCIAYYEGTNKIQRKLISLYQGNQPVWFHIPYLTTSMDAIDYYEREITQLNSQIQSLQQQILNLPESTPSSPHHSTSSNSSKINNFISTLMNPILLEKDTATTAATVAVAGSPQVTVGRVEGMDTMPLPFPSPSPSSFSIEDIPPIELQPSQYGYPSSTGFVTFFNRQTQVQAYQIHVLSDIYSNIKITQAPSHDDIIWENITASSEEQQHGQKITSIIFTGGMLFWGSVLAFIAAISTLSNLEKYLPFIKNLDPVVYSLLAGILPVIVMNIFLSLLPAIFGYGAHNIEKRKTKSDVQYEVFRWYFGYQLANVYLILLAGSLFTALADAIANPSSIIRLLAAALPSVSVFFINYLITEILTSAPGELLQLVPFLIWNSYKLFFKESFLTTRQLLQGPLQISEFDYGSSLPSYLFILCIVLTYMIIAPLMTIFGSLYFLIFYLVLKYKFLYIYIPSFETGGVFWYGLYNFSMKGLLVSSITMIGYMIVKEGVSQTSCIFPIPFIIWRYWSYTVRSFERLSKDMAYSRAVQADREEGDRKEKILSSFDRRCYTQSSLLAPWNEGPNPYRIDGKPLFNQKGELDQVYHREDSKEGTEHRSDLEIQNERTTMREEEFVEEDEQESGLPLQKSNSKDRRDEEHRTSR